VVSNGPTVVPPWVRIMSGASAANSTECLRMASALPPAHRVSIRTLWRSVHPHCCSPRSSFAVRGILRNHDGTHIVECGTTRYVNDKPRAFCSAFAAARYPPRRLCRTRQGAITVAAV
jgi:hypothetical protein